MVLTRRVNEELYVDDTFQESEFRDGEICSASRVSRPVASQPKVEAD